MAKDDDSLKEIVGTVQAEVSALRQIVKLLLVQHALSKSPNDPEYAIDAFAELVSSAFSRPLSEVEAWQDRVSRAFIHDQVDGAKSILAGLRKQAAAEPRDQ